MKAIKLPATIKDVLRLLATNATVQVKYMGHHWRAVITLESLGLVSWKRSHFTEGDVILTLSTPSPTPIVLRFNEA